MDGLAQSPATMALLMANIIVSLAGFASRQIYEENIFWIGPMKQDKQWYRALSSGFIHVNPPHLFLNMYVLVMFGIVLERWVGLQGFLLIYFAALFGGSLWSYKDNRDNLNYRAAGASGATSGIVCAFCLYAPFAELRFFGAPMPAIVFAAGYIGISYALARRGGGMIGHDAHLGGALAGLAMATYLHPEAIGLLMDQLGRL